MSPPARDWCLALHPEDCAMTTALVTGANGFIGSHLVRALLHRGYEVRCLVRSTSDLASLAGLPVAIFIGDLRDPSSLDVPTKGVDYIYHLAAELMVASEETFTAANTDGTRHMLEAASRNALATLKRFVFTSSQAAVGPGHDPTPLDETAPLKPISWYGTSKMKAEQFANEWATRLPVTIVRPPAVYGERETDLSRTYGIVANRLHPKLGLKKKHLSMVYVGDLVEGMVMAAESADTKGQTYFLSSPEELTDVDVTRTTGEAMGKEVGLPLLTPHLLLRLAAPLAELGYHYTGNRPAITRDKVREVSQRFWVANPSKAKRDFGWEAKLSLLEGMKKILPYFFAQRARVRALEGQGGVLLWIKYVLVSMAIGTVIEITSNIGKFYTFDPWWTVFVIVILAFGIGLGSVAMWLRRQSGLTQFLVGTALATAIELLAALDRLPFFDWEFAYGWPLGITDDVFRAFVVGLAGGVIVVLDNAILRHFYRRRLRVG
jgi:nucleoside-diphosphate-sugar epimerase